MRDFDVWLRLKLIKSLEALMIVWAANWAQKHAKIMLWCHKAQLYSLHTWAQLGSLTSQHCLGFPRDKQTSKFIRFRCLIAWCLWKYAAHFVYSMKTNKTFSLPTSCNQCSSFSFCLSFYLSRCMGFLPLWAQFWLQVNSNVMAYGQVDFHMQTYWESLCKARVI